jgi:very-long-chain enoyl-CoA reductase
MSPQLLAIQLGTRFLPCRINRPQITLQPFNRPLTDRAIGQKRIVSMAGFFPYPDNTSVLLCAMEAFLILGGPNISYKEMTGNNLKYSKFANNDDKSAAKSVAALQLPSKTAFLLVYGPAALVACAFLANYFGVLPVFEFDAAGDDRVVVVAAMLAIHFVKRVLETLFVHKYSGSVALEDSVPISTSYTAQTFFLIYAQLLSAGMTVPFPQLRWLGIALFAIGIAGNGYHHWMLANLRKDGIKKYIVPTGGLFGVFVCPHYIFEITDFVGIALVSQTFFGWCLAWFVLCYLTGRSFSTKQWYMKKVEGFPENRSVLIPGIF